jgi:hypothetical protein
MHASHKRKPKNHTQTEQSALGLKNKSLQHFSKKKNRLQRNTQTQVQTKNKAKKKEEAKQMHHSPQKTKTEKVKL